tara:strand:+ start:1010 stop:1951 length:942 start_codon:yes stop_codon:yes gene_type:complete
MIISNILRKLSSYLSFWIRDIKKISDTKDLIIRKEIFYKLKQNNTTKKNLKKTHQIFNKQIYLLLCKNNLESFLKESFIQKMFFLHNRFFVFKELNELKKSKKWNLYKKLIIEDSIGGPIRYFLYPKSSGNKINHVYHLSVLSKELDIKLESIKNVFEFGAGYGCMARIFSKIKRNISYTCFDTYYVNLLQYYYLKHNNLDVGFSKKNRFLLTFEIKDINNNKYKNTDLFIANWSLSETPLKFRNKFVNILKNSRYVLICFQEKFEEIDNLKYFNQLKYNLSNNYKIKIIRNKFYKGNFIKKQNHYYFLAKKL